MCKLIFWILLWLFATLPIWILFYQPAGADSACQHAYGTAWGCSWGRSTITTNDPLTASALRAWGLFTMPGDDIIVDYRPDREFAGWANPQVSNDKLRIVSCYIVIDSAFRESLPLMIHEVGHCLGLDHSWEHGDVMSQPQFEADRPTPHDLQRLHELYAVYQIHVAF